jgi:hypothetical protein
VSIARQARKTGYGVFGVPFVKFTLTYDGSLPASGNKPKNQAKWDIRKAFDPQLKDLWDTHPALREIELNGRYWPSRGGAVVMQTHHSKPSPIDAPPFIAQHRSPDHGIIDLCEAIEKHGAWFRPLVRNSFALHCGLNILFLRKEAPGKVYQGGDIDGRIKTLLDALAMPQHVEQVLEQNTTDFSPMNCLLEDDSLVSGIKVETERLLGASENSPDHVRLIIEVDVRVRQAMIYNQSFLG